MEEFILTKDSQKTISNGDNLHSTVDTEHIENEDNTSNCQTEQGVSEKQILKQLQKLLDSIGNNSDILDAHIENLIYFNNSTVNDGMHFGGHSITEVQSSVDKNCKKYDLSISKQFAEFGETVKCSDYFAVAAILCIFEYVTLDNLYELETKLLKELPSAINENGEKNVTYQNPFLSIENILKTINGKMFLLDNGESCIGLGNGRSEALKNLWNQFPALRAFIARWMIDVSDTFKFRTSIDTAQIAFAFINIIKIDFNAGVANFFSRFVSDPNKYWLLGIIGLELYRDNDFHDKILPHIIQWASSSSDWKWKSALYIYANLSKDEENNIFDKKVEAALISRFGDLVFDTHFNSNIYYISKLMTGSMRLRTLIASIFHQTMIKTIKYLDRRLLCIIYIQLLYAGYYWVSPNCMALPLVVCDKKQQLEDLMPILNLIISRYDTRQLLFAILESYFIRISVYTLPSKILNSLKAFFQLSIARNSNFYKDFITFLRKCDLRLTKDLLAYLNNIFGSDNTGDVRATNDC